MTETDDTGADVHVLRAVELRALRRGVGFGHASALFELAADDARVPDGRLVDGDHVVRQTVADDETTPFVFGFHRVL